MNIQVIVYRLHRHTLLLQEGESGSCSVELVPLTAASGKGHLQVWLGSSQGWSLPVSLIHPNPQVCLSLCTAVCTGISTPQALSASTQCFFALSCCQFAFALNPPIFHPLPRRNEPGKLQHSQLVAQHCHADVSRSSVEGRLTLLAAQQHLVDQGSVTERICISQPQNSKQLETEPAGGPSAPWRPWRGLPQQTPGVCNCSTHQPRHVVSAVYT